MISDNTREKAVEAIYAKITVSAWREVEEAVDALIASNLLRPLPTEEEIAEAIYKADEAWYAEDPKSGKGLTVRAWSRWMAKSLLALLNGTGKPVVVARIDQRAADVIRQMLDAEFPKEEK